MKLRELLQQLQAVQRKIGVSVPYLCGGTPRDKFMGRLDNIADIDITTGDKTVDYLSQEFAIELRKQYNVVRKTMDDGHSTIFIGNLKVDFSSNFVVSNIDRYLQEVGIDHPTDMQREMFSRDFTCNALLLTIDLKKILDPTKRGFQDIRAKKIKTCLPPEITLTSNRNRVVRAIYLACKLGFEVDPEIINYVREYPQIIRISTPKVTKEKLESAFDKDPEKAADLIGQMGLWNHLPILPKMQPYYTKKSAMSKRAYFQGGGGVNEPEPHHKKYPAEKAIVVQPRFKEPFYRNYDLYDVEGVNGPPQHGPGSGYHHMNEHDSIQEFLEFRRKRLQGKYVADDSYIEDTPANHKERVNKMKIRAVLLNQMVKMASGDHFKVLCSNCGSTAAQCRCPGYFHESEPQVVSYVKSCSQCRKTAGDNNDGPNFDYGKGLYSNMDKYKSVKDFEEHADKGPGAFFADDNDDHMLPPKEHGTSIYDWRNSPYQGKPKAPKSPKPRKCDDNNIDFPVDDDVNHDTLIRPEEGQYHPPKLVGPSGTGDLAIQPGDEGTTNTQIAFTSPQISGEHTYVPEHDFDGRSDDALNFGRDYDDESAPVGRSWDDNAVWEAELEWDKLVAKYDPEENEADAPLMPAETEIYGLPDGVESQAKDADQTIETLNPEFGTPDAGRQMYEDKWNI